MKKLLLVTLISLISLTVLSQSCLPEGITFTTQSQIDSFQILYPNCTEIEGNVTIRGEDIVNLNGLNLLTSIEGNLKIGHYYIIWMSYACDGTSLCDLSGLDNLSSIGGDLRIYCNQFLVSLTGLENLTSIGNDLIIGGYSVEPIGFFGNTSLIDLSALYNLTNVGNYIKIMANDALLSLTGMDNIDGNSISGLWINSNQNLTTCAIQSVCDVLASSADYVSIEYNGIGCHSIEFVQYTCTIISVDEVLIMGNITTSPNPFITSTILEYVLQQPEKVTLKIYNHLGQLVYQTEDNQPQGTQQLVWNAEGYADGIYYYRLQAGEQVANGKLVKVR